SVDESTLRRSLLRAMAQRRLHGEVLVRDFRLSAEVIDGALRRQLLVRLEILDRLPDAQISFRVAVRPPRGALTDLPLAPVEFLGGKRRARDKDEGGPVGFRARVPSPPPHPTAWRILGVTPGSDPVDIKRAYKRLARAFHPDLHPHASDEERRALEARLVEV